jgi:hypothetical protein
MTDVIRTTDYLNDQREVIQVIAYERLKEVTEIKTAFEFSPHRPAKWLQRLCLWTLAKLGCYASLETVKIERHHIGEKGERFMSAILRQRENLIGNFDREPKRLLIGNETYAQLMGEPVFDTGFSFVAEYYMGNGPGRRPTVCGLTVEVIPWMRGMLVMP